MNKQLQVRTPIRLKLGYFLNLFPFLNLQECFKFVWDTMVYFFNLNQLHCSSAGSKVQVTFHRSRVQDAAPSINYQITQIPLELMEHFLKRLGLGDTFNTAHVSVSW